MWDRIVNKHNLQNLSLDDLVGGSWEFTDNSLGGWGVVQQDQAPASELKVGVLLSTIKLMQAGALSSRPFLVSCWSARI